MSVADQIIAQSAIEFKTNSDDCNKFVKAVCAVFFEPDLFTGPNMDADAIITELRANADWKQLAQSHSDAIAGAKKDKFVIAGMTSKELGAAHGHLAVVVGDDGQLSGEVFVPICYAGSLNAAARVQRKRVSETFGATVARESKISYFSRAPQTTPSEHPVSRLVDHLRGIAIAPNAIALTSVKSRKKAGKRKQHRQKRARRTAGPK